MPLLRRRLRVSRLGRRRCPLIRAFPAVGIHDGKRAWTCRGIILLPRASGRAAFERPARHSVSGISRTPSLPPRLGETRRRVWKKPCGIPAADAMSKTDALRNGGGPFLYGGTASIPYGGGTIGRPHGTGRKRDISLYPVPCGRLFSGNEARRRFGIGLRWLGGGIAALPGHLCESPQSTRALAVPVTEGLPESVSPVRRTMLRLPPEAPSLPERFSCCPPPSRSGVRQGWRGTPRRPWRGPFRRG